MQQRPVEPNLLSMQALVLESMTEGVSVSDENGFILYTNSAEDRMFGYERGELVGRHVTVQNGYPADVNEKIVAEVIEQLKSSGAWKGEWLNRKKDGTAFYTSARITAMHQGGKSFWVCVQEDITDRRRAEMSLRDANERLHALIVASPLPIVAFSRDGLIQSWNPAAERVFGWQEAEVLGKTLPFIPEEKAAEHREMRERDLKGQGFTSREVRRRRKDGTPIDISVSTAAMHDSSGQVTGIMSVYVDVTEQKRIADEQWRSMELLQAIERQLTLLVEASGVLLASPESQQVQSTILDLAQRFISADGYAVWRKQPDAWRLIASTGLSDAYERTIRPVSGQAGRMPDTPLAVEDVEQSPLLASRAPLYRAEGIVSMLTVPLRFQGEFGGTLVFYYRTRHVFTDAERRIGGALGNLAASALGAAELYDRQAELRSVAEAAEQRSSFLAAVGEELASSLDYETTLARVAQLAVPSFADWCAVDVLDPENVIRRLAVQHSDPAKIEFARELRRRYPPQDDDPARVVLRTGEPLLMAEIPEALIVERARDAEHRAILLALGLKSVIVAPMVVRGRAVGVLTFVTSETNRRYTPADSAFAMEIARRAAVAVDNARLFKEVRESEERFRRLFDSNMVAVAFWNMSGIVTAANDAYLRILGLSRSEFERNGGVIWSSVTPPEYQALDAQIIHECLESGASGVHEKEYLRADGSRATVLIAAAFLSSSQSDGVAFVVDVTERKALDRRFRGVADAAIAIAGAATVEEILEIVNQRIRTLIRCCRVEIRLASPAVASMEQAGLSIAMKDRAGNDIGLLQLWHSDSQNFGEADRSIAVQLAEMASVAIENTELNRSLRLSNEELSRANEDLNQFAYSASHDLQEPLRTIAIYTQLLARKLDTNVDPETSQFMQFTLDGARRMEMLIRDLLAYTQAVNIRGTPGEPVDSGVALRKAIGNLQTAIEPVGAEIQFDDLPPVRAYEVHLVQLFQNLVGNALKYRGRETPAVRISAVRDAAGDCWIFTVRDNGIGIAPKYHQQVFGLFKRLHPAQQYPGTGIGLAICQRIVERYGGRIWVESEEGRGSMFRFTLPA